MSTGNEGATSAETEVTGQSPADDEQQDPEAEANQAAQPEDTAAGAEPTADPDTKYQGAKPDTKYQG